MKNKKIKEIKLVFENCEVCVLKPNMIKFLFIDNIKVSKATRLSEDSEIIEILSCDKLTMLINEKGLKQKSQIANKIWNAYTLEQRLQMPDVVSIILKYTNKKEEIIDVPWNYDDELENKYQGIKKDGDNMWLEIKK